MSYEQLVKQALLRKVSALFGTETTGMGGLMRNTIRRQRGVMPGAATGAATGAALSAPKKGMLGAAKRPLFGTETTGMGGLMRNTIRRQRGANA